jgi:hypothetical protein
MTLNAPIELNDDELLAVSGGSVAVGISQSFHQDAAVVQSGGSVGIGGGGNGATAFTGNLTFTQSFAGTITQSATNTNSGNVNGTVAVS